MNNKRIERAAGYYAIPAMFFMAFFFYFFIFNRYHLFYLEQTQLFSYDQHYLAGYFTAPGGFSRLAGAFVTQFFMFPFLSAFLVTLLASLVYLFSALLFNIKGLTGLIYPLVPIVILAGLQSHHSYLPANTVAWILVLAFVFLYAKLNKPLFKIILGITGWIILYFLTGFYAFAALFIITAIRFSSGKEQLYTLLAGLSLALAIPVLVGRFIYIQPYPVMWLSPATDLLKDGQKGYLLALLLYYPIVLTVYQLPLVKGIMDARGIKAWLPGTILLTVLIVLVVNYTYDLRNEIFLRIDHDVQQENWNDVLLQSSRYPGNNRLVMVYTNLALYNTGRLTEDFFNYRQSGTKGLWLPWQRNETAPFFGGEVFYELGYNNEAFRWAFEAMEAKGLNPRCLKRLTITSLVNGDTELANKYLHYLGETAGYRKWAQHYQSYVSDPSLIDKDTVLKEKRDLLITHDFVTDITENDPGLVNLLENHPDNRMAFEYRMITLLLQKDMTSFSSHLDRLGDLGYTHIPKLFEEAILLYSGMNKSYTLPKGFVISPETRERFHRYAGVFAANRQSLAMAESALRRDFGNSYWYYMQFIDNQKTDADEKL